MMPRVRLFVTKTDVRYVFCCNILESLFCNKGNLLGPFLLFLYIAVFIYFHKGLGGSPILFHR